MDAICIKPFGETIVPIISFMLHAPYSELIEFPSIVKDTKGSVVIQLFPPAQPIY